MTAKYAYLAGFMDADGSIKMQRSSRTYQLQWWNTEMDVIQGISDTLSSLGVYHTIYTRPKRDNYKLMHCVICGRLIEMKKLAKMLEYMRHPLKIERMTELLGKKPKLYQDYPVQEWVMDYQGGMSFSGIAKKYQCNRKTVTKYIREALDDDSILHDTMAQAK